MNALEQLQHELTVKLGEIEDILARFKYDARPNLLCLHSEGPEKSMFITASPVEDVLSTIKSLQGTSETAPPMTAHDAALKMFFGE